MLFIKVNHKTAESGTADRLECWSNQRSIYPAVVGCIIVLWRKRGGEKVRQNRESWEQKGRGQIKQVEEAGKKKIAYWKKIIPELYVNVQGFGGLGTCEHAVPIPSPISVHFNANIVTCTQYDSAWPLDEHMGLIWILVHPTSMQNCAWCPCWQHQPWDTRAGAWFHVLMLVVRKLGGAFQCRCCVSAKGKNKTFKVDPLQLWVEERFQI